VAEPRPAAGPPPGRPDPAGDDVVADTRDWTWVLDRPCPECGLDVRTIEREQVADVLRSNAMAWADLLDADPDELRSRPRPGRWSTLEYACHVRDVYRLFDSRLVLMLEQDDPRYPNWDQDATAVAADYRRQDPQVVLRELLAAADQLADRFDEVAGASWARTGTRSDGARFTVESFARYFIHDPVHHIWDVTGAQEEP
jgi:hypothetical protein